MGNQADGCRLNGQAGLKQVPRQQGDPVSFPGRIQAPTMSNAKITRKLGNFLGGFQGGSSGGRAHLGLVNSCV